MPGADNGWAGKGAELWEENRRVVIFLALVQIPQKLVKCKKCELKCKKCVFAAIELTKDVHARCAELIEFPCSIFQITLFSNVPGIYYFMYSLR